MAAAASRRASVLGLVSRLVAGIGLDPRKFATHSMLRTKATLFYRCSENLRAVCLAFGHSKLSRKVRHLGVEADHALAIAAKIEI